jgi:hypothetical protein
VRCGICRAEMLGVAYILTRTQPPGSLLTMSVCGECVEQLLGGASRSRLDRVLVKSGWVQPPLPNVT